MCCTETLADDANCANKTHNRNTKAKCGVFGQNPTKVAEMMKNSLRQKYPFKKVIFAIPKSKHNKNYEAFKKVFE